MESHNIHYGDEVWFDIGTGREYHGKAIYIGTDSVIVDVLQMGEYVIEFKYITAHAPTNLTTGDEYAKV